MGDPGLHHTLAGVGDTQSQVPTVWNFLLRVTQWLCTCEYSNSSLNIMDKFCDFKQNIMKPILPEAD